jgi:uncharacterized protein YebE (UPF0316 family)
MDAIIAFFSSFVHQYGTLVLIFTARIFDVSIGTVRIILVARGYRSIAPVLGFFEVLILAFLRLILHFNILMGL